MTTTIPVNELLKGQDRVTVILPANTRIRTGADREALIDCVLNVLYMKGDRPDGVPILMSATRAPAWSSRISVDVKMPPIGADVLVWTRASRGEHKDVQRVYNDGRWNPTFREGWRKGEPLEVTHWAKLTDATCLQSPVTGRWALDSTPGDWVIHVEEDSFTVRYHVRGRDNKATLTRLITALPHVVFTGSPPETEYRASGGVTAVLTREQVRAYAAEIRMRVKDYGPSALEELGRELGII